MLDTIPIESLPRTSGVTIKRLKNLGINTYLDLLKYFPFRYEDYSVNSTINTAQEGEVVTLKGTVLQIKNEFTKRGFKLQKAKIKDQTGIIEAVWYNQPFITKIVKSGTYISLAGPIEKFGSTFIIKPSDYEMISAQDEETIHTGRLVPVYPQSYGISTKTIREKIFYVIKEHTSDILVEFLPEDVIRSNNLMDYKKALFAIHFPKNLEEVQEARERLGFDELFIKILSSHLVKQTWQTETVTQPFHNTFNTEKKLNEFINNLPFTLTDAQKRSVDEIIADLLKTTPMNRFLQGDVGSGKTVVAAIAAYLTYLNGFQTVIMAPTEILAIQHHKTISKLLTNYPIKIALQTSANKTFTKKAAQTHEYDIIIGTQALLTEHIDYHNVGLVIIDEQHRFGVRQRGLLKQKGVNPHLLTMTATPIPRTVSLTIYSELDLSIIDEMPKGRLPIKTFVVNQNKRNDGYEWIQQQMNEHKVQTYVICPLIEESETETMQTVKAATKEYDDLKKIFKNHTVALLHGKMKSKEKEEVMQQFNNKKYDVLVSTSVVEVGIDVPNATIMIIEGAERFGLAQLHQLRGRVGRGDKQSYCFLYTSTKEAESKKRLQYFAKTNSGMQLAEYDLKLRGPGDIYGTKQHGYDDLQIANISDYPLVKKVKDAVELFTNKYNIEDMPTLKEKINVYQIAQISRD